MATATIKLVPVEFMAEFYARREQAEATAQRLQDQYTVAGSVSVTGFEGEAAAEEMFDLTNNPSRDDERSQRLSGVRSVSVGDIVCVDGVDYLCMSSGWTKLDKIQLTA